MRLIRLQAAFAALATGLIAACSPATEAPPAAEASQDPQASPPVTVRVVQYRSDEINRVVAVKVTNVAEIPVTVQSVEVVAPGFAGVGPVDFAATFPPGRSFDLRVPHGDPVCGEDVKEPVTVRLDIADQGQLELRPSEGLELLRRIHENTCSVSATLDALPLRWKKNGWRQDDTADGPVVIGTLLAGPVQGPDTMRIVDLEDTTLLTTSTQRLPGGLAPGRAASVDVVFTPQRCDAHAMADSKKGFEIGVRITRTAATDQDGVLVSVVPDVAAQDVLEEMVLERCGFANPPG